MSPHDGGRGYGSMRRRWWFLGAGVAVAAAVALVLVLGPSPRRGGHEALYNDLGGIAWGVEHGELVVYVVSCYGSDVRTAVIRIADAAEVEDSGDGRLVAQSTADRQASGNVTRFALELTGTTTVQDLEAAETVIVDVPEMAAAFMNDDEEVPDGQVNAGGWVATPEEFIDDVFRAGPGCG